MTADPQFAENMKLENDFREREDDEIVVGNWRDRDLLAGQKYDTVLADYLIGAVDGFSPYFQDQVFERLAEHMNLGGRLYVVGMQPVPFSAGGGAADVVCEVTRLRDACILLAGHRPYREYPVDWIHRHLQKAGFEVESTKQLPILHSEVTIGRQLAVAERKLPYFEDVELRASMAAHIEKLRAKVSKVRSTSPHPLLSTRA